jgi:uncharacterized membrane protein YkvI
MMIAMVITLMLDFDKILTALGTVTPFLVMIVMIIAVFSFINPSYHLVN